ncbi:GNAT family N-acetyltransferase [Mobilitalea sibirica]|uniref:GNAT family N-acetyltransferase n=1 Tax=Mobilitalea sibirica TaxID=1462919 RepID=A0A8J7H1C3_9FIRM|nr:GNAT family N-acetyltransferase [Mobilitalea sibirica]MBH1940184.1 GNAT family N-acetyltransferase [Mobilitalea sibirica]
MIKHIGTNSIETIRLILRRFDIQDANDMYHNWAGDPEVCKFLSWGPHDNISVTERRIRDWIRFYNQSNFYNWALFLKNEEKVIGSISAEILNDIDRTCEVGYCIGKEYWCRGIMTEALRAVMHYLFYEVGYHKIIAKHDVLNVASGMVMQKAGMQFDKVLFHANHRRDGSYGDVAVYVKNRKDD